jgi:hypothetical protein
LRRTTRISGAAVAPQRSVMDGVAHLLGGVTLCQQDYCSAAHLLEEIVSSGAPRTCTISELSRSLLGQTNRPRRIRPGPALNPRAISPSTGIALTERAGLTKGLVPTGRQPDRQTRRISGMASQPRTCAGVGGARRAGAMRRDAVPGVELVRLPRQVPAGRPCSRAATRWRRASTSTGSLPIPSRGRARRSGWLVPVG